MSHRVVCPTLWRPPGVPCWGWAWWMPGCPWSAQASSSCHPGCCLQWRRYSGPRPGPPPCARTQSASYRRFLQIIVTTLSPNFFVLTCEGTFSGTRRSGQPNSKRKRRITRLSCLLFAVDHQSVHQKTGLGGARLVTGLHQGDATSCDGGNMGIP